MFTALAARRDPPRIAGARNGKKKHSNVRRRWIEQEERKQREGERKSTVMMVTSLTLNARSCFFYVGVVVYCWLERFFHGVDGIVGIIRRNGNRSLK